MERLGKLGFGALNVAEEYLANGDIPVPATEESPLTFRRTLVHTEGYIMQVVRFEKEHERAYVNKCEIWLPLLPKCEAGVDRKPTG